MDARRTRRTRDQARKTWYAHYRQIRFARWFGFIDTETDLNGLFQKLMVSSRSFGTSAEASGGHAKSPAMVVEEALTASP